MAPRTARRAPRPWPPPIARPTSARPSRSCSATSWARPRWVRRSTPNRSVASWSATSTRCKWRSNITAGTVEKFIGDAVMAIFGVPRVHEDDALRAVRAAAEMRATLATLNAELDRDHGMTLACRIGVNTGEVVAGEGDQSDRDGRRRQRRGTSGAGRFTRRDPAGGRHLRTRSRRGRSASRSTPCTRRARPIRCPRSASPRSRRGRPGSHGTSTLRSSVGSVSCRSYVARSTGPLTDQCLSAPHGPRCRRRRQVEALGRLRGGTR